MLKPAPSKKKEGIMSRLIHNVTAVVLLGAMALFLACMDQDPFGLSKRRIKGDFYLEEFEGEIFYILQRGVDKAGGGILDGTVDKIGWNDTCIVALRTSIFRGDPDGWMIINVKSKKLNGPFSESELDQMGILDNMRIYLAKNAWKKL